MLECFDLVYYFLVDEKELRDFCCFACGSDRMFHDA